MKTDESKPWYDDNEPEDIKFLRDSLTKIKSGIKNGLSFDEASGIINFSDARTREEVLDDILKVIIAEMHFNGGKTIEDVAKAIRMPMARLVKARSEMMMDVEAAAIEAYHDSTGKKGNA